ncbi:hypothetical protein B0H13DRAFT_2349190 [Mycena leptocephala]|nr:hypothetical protein B0H13DRAFT_2349190 [Mycena leptocephala]
MFRPELLLLAFSLTIDVCMDSDYSDSLSPRLQKGVESYSGSSPPPPVRDARFYHESGDCIILVGDTLFKFIFIRDSPVFAGLFALPQAPGSVIEGSCDELPIRLSGDEEGPFRSLFKYLYAPALETQANRISITDLQDILAVADLAHKYEMTAWETWGFLVIGDLIRRHPGSLLSHDFVAIYNLCRRAFTQESEDLWAKTTVQWLERITDNDLPISDALNAAEASHDRHLLTSLYKIQLSRIPTTAASMFQPTKLSMDGIPPVHVQRILAGFCSLSLTWSELRQNMIALPHHAICSDEYHNTICIPATTSHWINAVTQAEKFSISEVGHRINAVIQHLSAQAPRNRYVSERCQYGSDALTPLKMWNQELARNMEGHFFVAEPSFKAIR